MLLLMGPTASGKTGLSLELARRLPTEIVSVDSALVYRGMDIGTAKPDAAQRARVPHHLIDILDPSQPYSAARFVTDAVAAIAEIRARGRIPMLVGGTMLYYRALQQGLSELPSAAPEVRLTLEAEARREGWPALHARLAEQDPVTAARLHPNDQQRIQRALEILAVTGRSPSEFYALQKRGALQGPVVKVALMPPSRTEIHERIGRRFHEMMAQGFLDEVACLHRRADLAPELPARRAVGYRQLWEHLDGACSLDEAVARGIAATRQFAKRQITWLRAEPGVMALDPSASGTLEAVLQALQSSD
ncbi:MAG TPA: tRNA (adenosine(37)-N6)-dimethylallyltransferase MiaA [Solimonas sp.]|nr:tRNA (adenosine(37)-N6)-dimethylallyltransferase MiaA [Solimonas sp.]